MEKPFWIDSKGNEYNRDALNDSHLVNIIKYLLRGGTGYKGFANDLEVIENILEESHNRGIYSLLAVESMYNDIISFRNEIKEYEKKKIDLLFDNLFTNKELNR